MQSYFSLILVACFMEFLQKVFMKISEETKNVLILVNIRNILNILMKRIKQVLESLKIKEKVK